MASKKELAIELYKEMSEDGSLTRAEFIARAQREPLNMTPAGAATYYANCKNIVSGKTTDSKPKGTSAPKTTGYTSQKVDDSKANHQLFSLAVVDGLDKSKPSGKISQVHSFFTLPAVQQKWKDLNAGNKARTVIVAGDPNIGDEIADQKILPTA